ncbi:hypothetical protein BV210_19210 (plasmid) [Halorientalis sp. IM1011]|uniref:hypothetical protein n=1 Tax=Halorientalis sp. IM1011 TaxID=1932360 RepID=UPI00097CD1EB|nr:hypothetical protein [Halorientalis sp. IM1011]AQL44890.1 hypothetical protein BV210_19210 [Halorientalis sp. IM1011]
MTQSATADHGTVRRAAPGEVTDVLAAGADAPGTTRVELYPESVYRPSTPWSIADGVVLRYNGATVEPRGDVDLHHVYPGGRVEDAHVNLRNVDGTYTSSVFRFDSGKFGFYGNSNPWHVRGGFTEGRIGEGTLFEFAQGGEQAIYFVRVAHSVRNIGTVVDMHRSDAYGINGCQISGIWYGFQRGIHTHNSGSVDRLTDNIAGNEFDVVVQPADETEILWDLERGRFNVLRGRFWDYGMYDDVMWRLHGDDADDRYGNVLRWFPVDGSRRWLLAENRVGHAFDDQVGSDRNRIVVPWLQGHPITDFTG